VTVALHVGQLFQRVPGGIGRYVSELFRALRAEGTVVVPFAAGYPEPRVLRELPGFVALGRPDAPIRYELWHRLRRPVLKIQADVVHAPSLAVPPTRLPLVVTVHDVAFLHHPETFTKRGLTFHRRGLSLARRYADVVVTPSEFTRQELIAEGFDPTAVFVAHHGVERTPEPDPEMVDRHLRRLGVTPPFVLAVGTIEPRKNLSMLVAALERTRVEHHDVTLVLAGARGWLEVPGIDRPWVRELGAVDEPALDALYRRATLYAMPSRYEGFGMPVLEAMTRRCPVIAADAASLPEVVGDAGLLLPAGQVADWADGLRRLLSDSDARVQLAERGDARAARFTWSASAERHLDAYREAAGRAALRARA
jgi:glycosyltransferase involved in cell wall biosynthesis